MCGEFRYLGFSFECCNHLYVLVFFGEENTEDILQEGLITKLLTEDVCHDVKALDVQTIVSAVSGLLERLKRYGEDCIKDKHTVGFTSVSFICKLTFQLRPHS